MYGTYLIMVILLVVKSQGQQVHNWGGGGIHLFMFTQSKNNRFQKKLIMQNTNI